MKEYDDPKLPQNVKDEIAESIKQNIGGLLYDLNLLPELPLTNRERVIAETIMGDPSSAFTGDHRDAWKKYEDKQINGYDLDISQENERQPNKNRYDYIIKGEKNDICK